MRRPPEPQPPSDEGWRRQLIEGTDIRWKRRLRNRLPSSPRCKMCAAPFAGVGGRIMPFFGHARWAKNPKYCAGCYQSLRANHGGAEVECSLLFADVRGSTELAERMSASEFTLLMGRFFDVATAVLVDEGAIVDKFVGDEVIGIFIPAMATQAHGEHAIRAAQKLLRETGHGGSEAPWVPLGVGVNTGIAYVGSIGQGMDTEILVPFAAAAGSGAAADGLERRTLNLKGKAEPIEVLVLAG